MKKLHKILLGLFGTTLLFSCQEYVNINNNPNGPEKAPALYLSPIIAYSVKSQQ